MGRSAKSTDLLKECMADALLQLMGEKPWDKITVDAITERAGVGRATWFRHFHTKNEALTYKIVQLWRRFEVEQGFFPHRRYSPRNVPVFFAFAYRYRDILNVIYRQDLQTAAYEAFYQIMAPQFGSQDPRDAYRSRFYSYGMFGLLGEWIRRDYRETPEELATMFRYEHL